MLVGARQRQHQNGNICKSVKKTKKFILKPIQDEDSIIPYVSVYAYKCVFQRCHGDLKIAKIGKHSEGDFLKSPQKLKMCLGRI